MTSQLISLYNVTPDQVGNVRSGISRSMCSAIHNMALSLGSLKGNRFVIVIRDLEGCDIAAQVGVGHPDSGRRSAELLRYPAFRGQPAPDPPDRRIYLRQDFESAVTDLHRQGISRRTGRDQAARDSFLLDRDPAAALHNLPVPMSYERSMLHHLVGNPGDYPGALQVLPPSLLSMFVSAFQSYLFNCALSMRFDNGTGLNEPVPGDRLIFENGREDFVTANNRALAERHIQRGKCRIADFHAGLARGPEKHRFRNR